MFGLDFREGHDLNARQAFLADSGSDVLNYAIAVSSRRTSLICLLQSPDVELDHFQHLLSPAPRSKGAQDRVDPFTQKGERQILCAKAAQGPVRCGHR